MQTFCKQCTVLLNTSETVSSPKVFFTNQKSQLPIKLRNGMVYMPWGRYKGEPGGLPLCPIIPKYIINKGLYDGYFPKPVKVLVAEYGIMVNRRYDWVTLFHQSCLMGLVLKDEYLDYRAYLVGERYNYRNASMLMPISFYDINAAD